MEKTQRSDVESRSSPESASIGSKTYGTVSADRQKQMSGLEFVQGLVDGTLPLNMIAQTLGYDVTEAGSGRVVVTVEPSEAHLNPSGTVHGTRCPVDPGERPRADDCRVQDFPHSAHHAGNRSDQGRGSGVESRPADWHR
jgi:hypothetical protein